MKSYAYLHSPAGLLEVVEHLGKIISISFCSSETHVSHTNILLDEAILQLDAYFKGIKVFNLPLAMECGEFEKKVYKILMQVPYGQTLSYKELATLAESPNAYRAVGSAMAKNRFVIVVPCHRVIKEDGHLGHYSGIHGVKTKEWLLEHEKSF
ncbi:MAG TPA: methylated-DNA--[protein]-cysteine S-methyltransferase, partial [Campylobacterales bacterium]|nr:methylated-DNA--[protein]-cysteine S-methyltransferase [Campylobacterales bacterium]